MKKLILSILLILFPIISSAMMFDWESQSSTIRSNGWTWLSKYEIAYDNDIIFVDLDLNLKGDVPYINYGHFEYDIENLWSKPGYDINVDFVDTDWDYSITIDPNVSRSSLLRWNRIDHLLAGHEIGHMFGLFDEYEGGGINPETQLINTGGLMHVLTPVMLNHYYVNFDNWLEQKLSNPVPIPPSALLLLSGLISIFIIRRRRI